MSLPEGSGPVTLEAALEVIAALAEAHRSATRRALRTVVAFGGTAMAALAIRMRSEDIDVYVSDIDDAVLESVTQAFRGRFGPAFKIDATPSKQLWGAIVIDDVETSPLLRRVRAGNADVEVRSLSAETMYLVKTAADRSKDQADIEALARRTTYEKTLARAKQLFPWYADRGAFPEQAERLARYMARDHRKRLAQVDRDFGLPAVVSAKVQAIRDAMAARFMVTLKSYMRKRPDLIAFDPRNARIVSFDAHAAGAPDEIVAMMKTHADTVADMAANTLKECDPERHMKRMAAVKDAIKGPA